MAAYYAMITSEAAARAPSAGLSGSLVRYALTQADRRNLADD
jgi:hypothetical protein